MPGTFNLILPQHSRWALSLVLGLCLSLSDSIASSSTLCLYVAPYNAGKAWSDGVERGLRNTLADNCEDAGVYMETHRYPEIGAMKKAGLAAFELARDLQPDIIIITSDDNSAKYLKAPYLVDTATPVVFTGNNWTVQKYDFPAKNVTDMIEVAPKKSMLTITLIAAIRKHEGYPRNQQALRGDARIPHIGTDNLSERALY